MRPLLADDFIAYDDQAQVCLLVNALRWQQPANPNQVKAAVRKALELPDNRLFDRFLVIAEQHAQVFAQALREGLAKRFPERFGQPLVPGFGVGGSNTPSPSPTSKPPSPPTYVQGSTPARAGAYE